MLPVFLQITPKALELAGFDAHSVWYLVYFLAAVVLALIYLQWRLRHKRKLDALSNRFMQVILNRGLTKAQHALAQQFFQELKPAEQDEALSSQRALARRLQNYLASHAGITGNDRVEIFDKILPGATSRIEIKDTADLREGEMCAVDIGKKSHLATVMKKKDDQVLLTLFDKVALAPGEAHIYAYRPQLGGYLIPGSILKVNGLSVVFKHEGAIEFRGDQHLMTVVPLGFSVTAWPHPELDVTEPKEGEARPIAEIFSGTTERTSDRAISVRFANEPPPWVMKRQEFWELSLGLPEKPLECRVRITDYRAGMWLLRPVDLDGAERQRLYRFIAEHEPVREHF